VNQSGREKNNPSKCHSSVENIISIRGFLIASNLKTMLVHAKRKRAHQELPNEPRKAKTMALTN